MPTPLIMPFGKFNPNLAPLIPRLIPIRGAVRLLLALLLAGCATVGKPPATPAEDALAACQTLYREVDTAIKLEGVRDHGSFLVSGFPYLRTTRLLASFRDDLIEQEQWSAWAGHMAALDAEARALELRNLSAPVAGHPGDTPRDELNRCRERLLAADLAQPERRAALRVAARVPDDYVTWWRVAGLYPLTAPIVSANIRAWHAETRNTFATPLTVLPVAGELVRWALQPGTSSDTPMKAAEVSEILNRSRDLLGIPSPKAADLDRLFEAFSPVWEVDVVNDNDRIGMLRWDNGPVMDVARPTLYRKISHTRFGGQVLLQLNYIVWFPARPGNDIYAGRLDGINWRVTLGPDGEPWLFDAIHNCGCYHQFFPSRHLRLRSDLPGSYFEPPLLPQPAPGQRPLVLRIAHHTHFIQRVYFTQRGGHEDSPPESLPAAQAIAWEEYDALRSLPVEGGYHSLFGEYGLIDGTERSERFILWPMGIRSPGAMRQWGRHATAFVGRRHFDDPFLIESLFERVP
ncbi:MAG: hypothetical protein A3H31_01225 [Gallionellales bacterium RIFCSPLOWO2_02_FULL_57_47]|nr:MAG: hypothetical protein A3H31_01225 [Gallionellales bacterium RIFCSPLOWO2_02_FULL_57_47]